VVVDAEINGTIKTTLRSERRSLLEKEKKEQENQKRGLDKVGIVRDVRLRLPVQTVAATPPNALIRECFPRQNPSIWPFSIRTKPGWCSADLTLASGFGLCFHCKLGSSSVLRRPIETT
jgi:hypothetical protein